MARQWVTPTGLLDEQSARQWNFVGTQVDETSAAGGGGTTLSVAAATLELGEQSITVISPKVIAVAAATLSLVGQTVEVVRAYVVAASAATIRLMTYAINLGMDESIKVIRGRNRSRKNGPWR